MSEFLQQLINGLSLGAIYALIALGYTLVYGVLRFINFAHSDVFMVGAFIGYFVQAAVAPGLGESGLATTLLVLLSSMIGCGLLGVLIEYLVYRPLRDRPKLTVLITAIGVSLFLEYTGQLPFVFGADPRTYPTLIENTQYALMDGVSIGSKDILLFVVSFGLMLTLRQVVLHTRIGTAMRAVSTNMKSAQLMGVNLQRVISFTFFIGSALAGAGGTLFAVSYPKINPLMGILPGLKAFVAAVLGGIGSIPGAALGGLLIGLVETFIVGYGQKVGVEPAYADAIVFAILIVILIFKPTGLLGRGGTEKV